MPSIKLMMKCIILIFLLFLSVSCTGLQYSEMVADRSLQHVSTMTENSSLKDPLLNKYAPAFILEGTDRSYNRIGTPALRRDKNGNLEGYVDPHLPTIYAMKQNFQKGGADFTNLIYRIHFEKTPLWHLTAGKNAGLIFIVTLNQQNKPLLLTTVHTCGCYLALIPTTNLSVKSYPDNWNLSSQHIYGESLPGLIEMAQNDDTPYKFVFHMREDTHRVMHIDLQPEGDIASRADIITASLKPMEELRNLAFDDSKVSFFETIGPRKGYVRNSQKPLERLLMSWWSMDWRIGEDKDLGPKEQTGATFYTSLKFWAWNKSDLWNFANFLRYWGWEL